MSKLEQFKNLAQAAFDPIAVGDATPVPSPAADAAGLHGTERLKRARLIPLDRLSPDATQPRKHFPEKTLRELAASIAAHGVLQPLTVSYSPDSDSFTIVTGERRYRAARRAGLDQVPCIILNQLSDEQRFYQQLVENLHREDITPFEEADAFRLLADQFHLTHGQIARTVAKSRTYVTKTIGLARIPAAVRRLCAQRRITSREQLVLLAQQRTEPAMRSLLEKLALHGHDVRSMRQATSARRARPRRSQPYEFRYQTRGCTVRVRFNKHTASKREVAQALRKALNSLSKE